MTQRTTPQQARPKALTKPPRPEAMRIRKASEVFRLLAPSPAPKPLASVPIGLWRTGWLPSPQGAAS